MRVLRHHRRLPHGEGTLDVEVRVALPADVEANEGAREAVLEALLDHLAKLGPRDWSVLEADVGDRPASETVPYHAKPAVVRPPRPRLRPRDDVELRPHQRHLCNRLVETIYLLGVRGKAVTLTDIERSGRMPQQGASRLLRKEATRKYLEPYLREWRDGVHRMFDLTDEGRRLASLVRAGEVPT